MNSPDKNETAQALGFAFDEKALAHWYEFGAETYPSYIDVARWQHSQDVAKFEKERVGHIELFTETRKLYEKSINLELEKAKLLSATLDTVRTTLEMARDRNQKLEAALERIIEVNRDVVDDFCESTVAIASQALAESRK